MQLASWIRPRLWKAADWQAELAILHQECRATHGPERARAFHELGLAFAACAPDRSATLALFVEAARGGILEAAPIAIRLARELRAHVVLGELLLAAGLDADAGYAYLDGGLADQAVEPLRRASSGSGSEAARCKTLLTIARGVKLDAEHELAAAQTAARSADPREAAAAHTHVVRLARLLPPARTSAVMMAAARACRGVEEIEAHIVDDLVQRGALDQLLDHLRARFDGAATAAERVECMRAAAMDLHARDVQRGLALRLLRFALETAYDALLPEIEAHVAIWEVLVAHARTQLSLPQLRPLIARALDAPLDPDVGIYLARLGLEIEWEVMKDAPAARPFAASLLRMQPDHPVAAAFARRDEADHEVAHHELPELPAIRIATPASARSEPPPAKPYAGVTGRIVRGVSPAMVGSAQRTGRVALLTPSAVAPATASAVPAGPVRAPRAIVPIDAVVELPSGAFFSTVLRDASTSGAFVVTKRALELGTMLGLELLVPAPDRPEVVWPHGVQARIVRKTDAGYGVQFVAPSEALVAALGALTPDSP